MKINIGILLAMIASMRIVKGECEWWNTLNKKYDLVGKYEYTKRWLMRSHQEHFEELIK